jgi:prophage tail gpP-like protein
MQSTASDVITVKSNGQAIGGWTGARVTRGIERLPSGVALEFTELYPGQASPAVIDPGNTVQVYLGPDLILTGYANLYWPHEDQGTHIVRAEARSKTQDLVDCSLAPPAALPPWYFHAASFKAIAEQLCNPFKIQVVMPDGDVSLITAPNGASIPPFSVNPGETPAELLEYMARTVQLLMYDDPQGRLVLAKVGTTRAGSSLVEGVNCEVAEARLSDDQRYSQIYVVGQAPVKGSVPPVLNIEASAQDTGVKRYRPKLIVMDMPGPDLRFAQQRANWEVSRRIGRSMIVDVTVTGWRDGNGALWTPNTITNCSLPSMKVERDMLIAEVAWLMSDAGQTALLTLMPPEGFQPQPFYFNLLPGYQDPSPTETRPENLGT